MDRFGNFEYAPKGTVFNPESYERFLKSMLKADDQSKKVDNPDDTDGLNDRNVILQLDGSDDEHRSETNQTPEVESEAEFDTGHQSDGEIPDNMEVSLKRPGQPLTGAVDKKLKICSELQNKLTELGTELRTELENEKQRNTVLNLLKAEIENEKQKNAVLNLLKAELETEKQKNTVLNLLKDELETEKMKNAELNDSFTNVQNILMQKIEENLEAKKNEHSCIVCGKQCFKFCGQDCVMYAFLIL